MPTKKFPGGDRQALLRSYLLRVFAETFARKADLTDLSSLKKLGRVLIEDLTGGLVSLGFTVPAAQDLATEAVGAALARRAVGWLRDVLGKAG